MNRQSRLRPAPHWQIALAALACVMPLTPARAASPAELATAYAAQSGASPRPAPRALQRCRKGREVVSPELQ
jgi:hypothetical protein